MMTKFIILVSLITLCLALLVGCSSAGIATVSAINDLSSATRLALGTLKLEDTNQAVTSAQATELLTLWQGHESLSNRDTTSQMELEAWVNQIQGVMTPDQIKAIDAMDIVDQSVSETLGTLGGSDSAIAPSRSPSSSGLSQAAPAGGPGGMPGGGGDNLMSEIGGTMSTQSTPAATIAATSADKTLVNPVLIQGLIRLLVMRSQSTG